MTSFSHEIRYAAAPADVYTMLADPAFREQVCEVSNTISYDVQITPDGDGMTVVVDQTQPADGIPSFATKFVGDKVHILQKETWSDSSHGQLDVTIPGKPGHVKGTITLEEDGDGTVERIEAEVKVSIPLVGGKLEKLISELLRDALDSEEKVGKTWLAG